MHNRLRFTISALCALGTVVGNAPASKAAVGGLAPVASVVDVNVARAANSAVSFQTAPGARCVLSAPGTRATMVVYADDRGRVGLHFTPARNGADDGNLRASCSGRAGSTQNLVRVHIRAGAVRAAAVHPPLGAAPLVPRGMNPATLTAADIKRLQLPPRPDPARDARAYAQWQRAVTTPVVRVGGSTVVRPDVIHGPGKLAHLTRAAVKGKQNGYATSGNWSGIVAGGATGQFTYWVAGQWVVPAVSTDFADSPAYSSVWDGIDGWGSGDVIQNGTEQDAFSFPFFGSFSFYSAWYEFYPDNGSTTLPNFGVNPGDEIYAVSWLCYDGNGNRYGCYYMEDLSQGEASPVYSELGSQPGLFAGNSAEWVTERPTVGGNLNPLPQFADFPFWWEHVYDSFAGGGYAACSEAYNVVSMYNGFDELATANPTSCESSTFSWLNFQ